MAKPDPTSRNTVCTPRLAVSDARAIRALLAPSALNGHQLAVIETDRHGETVAYLQRQPVRAVRS
jgi:hypothetical protein